MKRLIWTRWILAVLICGCGGDDASKDLNEAQCPWGQLYDSALQRCVRPSTPRQQNDRPPAISTPDAGSLVDTPDGSFNNDIGGEVGFAPDGGSGLAPDVSAPAGCPDRDGDGHHDIACGGTDCDDDEIQINPDRPEWCDVLDNNCDGQVNEDIVCSFYAHTSTKLYQVDPFAKSLTEVSGGLPDLFDIDTTTGGGRLYGVTSSRVYQFDSTTQQWLDLGQVRVAGGTNINGFAIDPLGRAFITGSDRLYAISFDPLQTSYIGAMAGHTSSGDCVINKGGTLYMTSRRQPSDLLVEVSTEDASVDIVGPIGYTEVYGLTAAWTRLWGVTGDGHLLSLDASSGAGTLVHTFEGVEFYGAASTPSR